LAELPEKQFIWIENCLLNINEGI